MTKSMQIFTNEAPLIADDIDEVERDLALKLPIGLRALYLRWNGGSPNPYVYEDSHIDTVVAEVLPLKSFRGTGTSVDSYRHLVLDKKIVPGNFFPFAVDGGGDFFFVDCASSHGSVYFYRSDTASEADRLVNLEVQIDDFWLQLKDEDQ